MIITIFNSWNGDHGAAGGDMMRLPPSGENTELLEKLDCWFDTMHAHMFA